MFKSLQDKIMYIDLSSQIQKNKKNVRKGKMDAVGFNGVFFRVRRSSFSLKMRAIQPSAAFGTRGRNALREEGFAWVPDLWSFLKLQEVGVSPYLSFILILMFFDVLVSLRP